jgi:thiol-disulfide isomerase/thioredoxin
MIGLTAAPEVDSPAVSWFNVNRPLSLGDLKGRLVILDFFTFGCINCMHALPALRRIEEMFADLVVVISVHAPKYTAERRPEALLSAIARLDIRHPVIHDPDMVLWDAYGILAWPTLVFIGPDGKVLGDLQGEPCAERLLVGIGEMLRCWRRGRDLVPTHLDTSPADPAVGHLRFPGAIKAVRSGDGNARWVLADTGHHQIVLYDDLGRETARFGCGQSGFIDLDAAGSAFCQPQGVVAHNGSIYVADTGNHAIRRIDTLSGQVTTLAGTGSRGGTLGRRAAGHEAELASVWDLEIAGERLFFANAGTHQIGALDLATGMVETVAGSGCEDLIDGEGARAQLAQPSGLALDPAARVLYFADSESSAIRVVHLTHGSRVETLVGKGLFDFGDEDGPFAEARLQHCQGVAWWDDRLLVADSYNDAVRVLDLATRRVSAIETQGFAWSDGPSLADGGLAAVAGDGADRLLISDTNHHRIVEVRLDTRAARIWAA